MANTVNPDVLEVNFNLIDQRALESGLFDRCAELNIGVIARTPFAFGILTGRYAPGVEFPSNDHRSNWPRQQLYIWASAPRAFAPLAEDTGRSNSELSLLFCLSHPAVSSVIPGIMSVQEATQNAATSNMTALTPDKIELATKIYSENEFFVRPRDTSQ